MKAQRKKTAWLLALAPLCMLLSGCGKYYLSLTQQNIDESYLSSVHVDTPDPRQDHPPLGEMIVMDWRVPKELLKEDPVIVLHVIYWDYTEKTFTFPINRRMGYVTYKDLDEEYTRTQGILTYKADIKTADGKIYKEWKHQLWVNLITLEETNAPATPQSEVSLTVDSSSPPNENPSLEELQEQEIEEQNDTQEEYEAPQPPEQKSSQQQLNEVEQDEEGNMEEQEAPSPSLEEQQEEEYQKSIQPATNEGSGTEESNPSE